MWFCRYMDTYNLINNKYLNEKIEVIKNADCVVVDSIFPKETIQYLIQLCGRSNIPIGIIPASIKKVRNILKNLAKIDYLIFNKKEAEAFWNVFFKY